MNTEAARAEVLQFLGQWERRPRHVLHVARLALQLFDDLAALHGLGERDRLLLEAAACLHDVGNQTANPEAGKGHHKVSAQLIREHAWQHLSLGEVDVVAQVARYHRKSLPRPDHKGFAMLTADEQDRVRKLAALLRIADGLDSEHEQLVARVGAAVFPGQIQVLVMARAEPAREIAAAELKADLARIVFAREVRFTAQPAANTGAQFCPGGIARQ